MAIYYLCPEHRHPVGGVRVIYRHVDILNAHGIPAYVVHRTPGFRTDWFDNDTAIVYWRDTRPERLLARLRRRLLPEAVIELPIRGGRAARIGAGDILVVPEIYGPDLAAAQGRGIPKVVLNQNCYLTFNGYSLDPGRRITPYQHPDVLATLVNSEDGEDYLRHAFPALALHRFRLSIDPERFAYRGEKRRQLCFSCIKNRADAMQVINILKFRDALRGFEVVPFINRPQQEVARIYQDSALFLSFGYPEGFGLPAAEAMACGCVVVGFHGGGGREFFRPEFSYPIEQGDILGFARTVERVIEGLDRDPETFAAKGRAASEFIHAHYAPEREGAEVLGAWRAILERAGQVGGA
ncbi:glycosyltransferase [Marichromatium gracile]|uniref:Glycosyl transferase family 1 n=1 Tax=Marichromatium gracile TaxID=1048 RepID=A0ABR5VCI7_MARGR|nr:glycosyltransferase [Marichromatium gracile]KXX63330.1 glycosyl transferase family 1 [Marichromatium gracile]